MYSEHGDDESKSGSGIEISEEMIAKAFLSSHMKHDIAEKSGNKTDKRDQNPVECIDRLAAKKHCLKQPQSPVSQFLMPLLEAENNGDSLLTEIFYQLSPLFKKMKGHEDRADQISTLEVCIFLSFCC